MPELLLLACLGWWRAGRWRSPCWVCGPRLADLVVLLGGVDRRCWICRLKASLGMIPDPRATAKGGHLGCFLSWFTKPSGDGASSTLGVLVSASPSCGAPTPELSGGVVLVERTLGTQV